MRRNEWLERISKKMYNALKSILLYISYIYIIHCSRYLFYLLNVKYLLQGIKNLQIKQASLQDQGWYSCELTPYNQNLNTVSGSVYLSVLPKNRISKNPIILIAIIIAFLMPTVILSLYIYQKWMRTRKQRWDQWSKKIIIDLNTLISEDTLVNTRF
jgi:hypothetical protein